MRFTVEHTAGRWNVTQAFSGKRVNLGCGRFPLKDYCNLDAHEEADLSLDFGEVDFSGLEEVRMDHFLEHFSWRQTIPLLKRVHSWLVPGGLLRVEVPDMEAILDNWRSNDDWLRYLYGSQQHEGEYHKTGFTRATLLTAIHDAGFRDITVEKIVSDFKTRRGMPCLLAMAHA